LNKVMLLIKKRAEVSVIKNFSSLPRDKKFIKNST